MNTVGPIAAGPQPTRHGNAPSSFPRKRESMPCCPGFQTTKAERQFSPQRGIAATKPTKAGKAVFLTEAPRHGARQKGMDTCFRRYDGKRPRHCEQINAQGCKRS